MKKKYFFAFVIATLCNFTWASCQITTDNRTQSDETGETPKSKIPSQRDIQRFISNGWVCYGDFGAKGDGITNDIMAIAITHEFANKHHLTVKADDKAIYYIGGEKCTVSIQTNTEFGKAAFIIDDTDVEDRNAHVFSVNSIKQSFKPKNITSLKKDQDKLDITLPGASLVTVTDSNVKRYIRFGANQNNGSSQTDIFIVDKNGTVDKNTPIIWDFERITEITILPVDETMLTISGGKFTTIANREESKYSYFARGIAIKRSNVIVDGLEHRITGEEDHGAPYGGFISISNCSNVTVRNTFLTGHKVYRTVGSAGIPVSMGSYDININRALNITFENCSQTNDINNVEYWGIMGSNYCKNIVYDHCTFSRFDAHMGVANATIRHSTLGHQGINAIGSGIFTVENSTINATNLINLRSDYGSTWEGEFFIRNCVFVPRGVKSGNINLIGGSNNSQHDFGYTCYMPERITIENLQIDDSSYPEKYQGPAIFANFNKEMTDETYLEKVPFIKTKKVILTNVSTASGLPLRISDNAYMFKDVIIVK
ncbi:MULTISPECIES: hypothetical protein [unclassified Proteiniphilum]|jgi:hypothetical protein|uniref:hypothetical protein n=1 Tax=unclassified Proteiniphilum TaxID=2622718 RepID=UPI000E910559|nr:MULTISPECIES: hypothetical protein [unclassified Proteiniphilum]MEA4995318.1 hypothetical protein [Petrimonas sp.]MEA5063879.1 hypothetical protein [Petrimonas sp.]MEA5128008.1 hypothetical protein [Proteiniphilum sp.]HBG57831.1 hypothetical protein [Porphyromonadaceae bacterium]